MIAPRATTCLIALALAVTVCGARSSAAWAARVSSYQLPQGSQPHDVAPAPDGSVWFTAQGSGQLGRLDPRSGKLERIPLGEASAPHGVIIGPDGAAWVTDSGLNANVRIDSRTNAVQVFPLPEGFANAGLNAGTFDARGIYWFTGQNGVYGRVDPATGKTDAWRAPKGAGPYGITTTASGEVWYTSLAGNYIAKIDTVSGQASVVDAPRPAAGLRRIFADSRNVLWVTFGNSGEIGRYDPKTRQWKTWPLPKAGKGSYAIYVDARDKVWISDFSANAILRFDPLTQRFESFPSARLNASVRQLSGRKGEVWGAESGADRLVVIRE